MKTHLTDLELLAIAERDQDLPHEAAHLDVCADCREKLSELRDALHAASAIDIPEPSPLFWDHFSARVRESLDGVEPGAGSGWRTWILGSPFTVATAVAAVMLIAIGGALWRAAGPAPANERPDMILDTAGTGSNGAAASAVDLDADADSEWALVRDVADEMSWDDAAAAGCLGTPGSADDAAFALTAAERLALVQLLREEMKSGA